MKETKYIVRIEPKERTLTPDEAAEIKDATMRLIDLIAKKIAEKILAEAEEEAS